LHLGAPKVHEEPALRAGEELKALKSFRCLKKELRAVLHRWETAYSKENFYRGIRILLDSQASKATQLVITCALPRFDLWPARPEYKLWG
jgi:hypothetical protein